MCGKRVSRERCAGVGPGRELGWGVPRPRPRRASGPGAGRRPPRRHPGPGRRGPGAGDRPGDGPHPAPGAPGLRGGEPGHLRRHPPAPGGALRPPALLAHGAAARHRGGAGAAHRPGGGLALLRRPLGGHHRPGPALHLDHPRGPGGQPGDPRHLRGPGPPPRRAGVLADPLLQRLLPGELLAAGGRRQLDRGPAPAPRLLRPPRPRGAHPGARRRLGAALRLPRSAPGARPAQEPVLRPHRP